MKDYLDDLLVWVIIIAILAPVYMASVKRKQVFIAILGLLIFLGSIPAAFMSELSIRGCCGAPSNGLEGLGYFIGVMLAGIGILLMVFSKKLSKK